MTVEDLLTYILSLEGLSTLFAIIYLVLAIKQNIWCWAFGIVSTCIFFYLMLQGKLYMEAALQVFYLCISFYGIWQWKFAKQQSNQQGLSELKISTWTVKQHCLATGIIILLALSSGYILKTYTDAALPFIDSLTSWGGVIATFMVARKIFENWYYWFVIDAISIYLYYERGFFIYAFLFCIYLVLIIFGYNSWRKALSTQ